MSTEVLERAVDLNDPATWPEPPPRTPPFDDWFVRYFVTSAAHIRRFATYYGVALVWLLIMVALDPIGIGGDGLGPFAAPGGERRATVPAGAVESASVTIDSDASGVGADGAVIGTSASIGGGTFDELAEDMTVSSDSDTSATWADSNAGSSASIVFDNDPSPPTGPAPLTIVESGYASVAGGTPLEVEPANGGLPVTVSGGQEMRRSYVRLRGDTTAIKLKELTDPGATQNVEMATARLCQVRSADWVATRKQAMSSAPSVDMSMCATGTRTAQGLWTFDLSMLDGRTSRNGLAIVPGPNTGGTFQVVFAPAAVTG